MKRVRHLIKGKLMKEEGKKGKMNVRVLCFNLGCTKSLK
jgi:hypothetical protein